LAVSCGGTAVLRWAGSISLVQDSSSFLQGQWSYSFVLLPQRRIAFMYSLWKHMLGLIFAPNGCDFDFRQGAKFAYLSAY